VFFDPGPAQVGDPAINADHVSDRQVCFDRPALRFSAFHARTA
jgi:hypothetical protein